MKRLLIIVGLVIAFTSCAPQQQLISETPKTTRVAEIHNDKVIIVTKTTITKEHYNELIAARKINK
jgi:4-hydroxy-3-methylbut-2-enyl diphosphate reductase IspH